MKKPYGCTDPKEVVELTNQFGEPMEFPTMKPLKIFKLGIIKLLTAWKSIVF